MQSRMTLELPPKLILALGVALRLRRCLEKIKLIVDNLLQQRSQQHV